MYNTKIVCTYNTSDVFLECDDISEEEKGFIRDVLYRQELLNILDIKEYNEEGMNNSIHELYQRLTNCEELKECMKKLANRFLCEDLETGLMFLFAYDYMHLTHVCISEYFETGQITQKNILNLKNII
jgi:hypothetical protein